MLKCFFFPIESCWGSEKLIFSNFSVMSFTILPSSFTAFSFTNRFASFPDFTIPESVISWVIEIRSGQSLALISIVGNFEDPIFSLNTAFDVSNASSAFIFPWHNLVTSFAKTIFASFRRWPFLEVRSLILSIENSVKRRRNFSISSSSQFRQNWQN